MKFNKTTLSNGLKVITIPMEDNPAVTVLVTVETGSKYEKKEIERREDLLLLAKAGEVMVGEHEEWQMKDKGRKDVFRRAWLE